MKRVYKNLDTGAASQKRSRPDDDNDDARETTSTAAALLPVRLHSSEFIEAFRTHETVVLVAETGSGKSTQIPQLLLEAGLARGADRARLVCTQPRRMAAITLAERVAGERRTRLGGEVGFAVRFAEQCEAATPVRFVTDGVLLREAMTDPELSR